jgi:hypothetical protein
LYCGYGSQTLIDVSVVAAGWLPELQAAKAAMSAVEAPTKAMVFLDVINTLFPFLIVSCRETVDRYAGAP